jgi:hypothetical protein
VLETLEPLPEGRKCFRMINGVLVERTVKEVVPALKTNSEGLKTVLDGFVVQYKAKQDEMDKWKACRSLYTLIVESLLLTLAVPAEKEQRTGGSTAMRDGVEIGVLLVSVEQRIIDSRKLWAHHSHCHQERAWSFVLKHTNATSAHLLCNGQLHCMSMLRLGLEGRQSMQD